MSELKYSYTILYVKNVKDTIEFYEKAFGFKQKILTPEQDYGEVTTGETALAFTRMDLAKSNLKNGFIESHLDSLPFGIEIGFATEDVEGCIKKAVEAGAKLEEDIKTKPWGQKVAYLRDINGFLIEVCTPMK